MLTMPPYSEANLENMELFDSMAVPCVAGQLVTWSQHYRFDNIVSDINLIYLPNTLKFL